MSFTDDPGFKKLKEEYYQKLKASGFRDVENEHGDLTNHQSTPDLMHKVDFRTGYYEIRRDYFIWASQQMEWGRFMSPMDAEMWRHHADGKSTHEISRILPYSQTTVYRRLANIRLYLKREDSNGEEYE